MFKMTHKILIKEEVQGVDEKPIVYIGPGLVLECNCLLSPHRHYHALWACPVKNTCFNENDNTCTASTRSISLSVW